MNIEDEYLTELILRDNRISYFKEKLEDAAVKQEDTTVKLEDAKQELEQQKEIVFRYARILKEDGTPTEAIQEKTMLSDRRRNKVFGIGKRYIYPRKTRKVNIHDSAINNLPSPSSLL